MFAADDPVTSLALQAVSLAGFYASTPLYLLFLSTLPTRTMAWLRLRWVRAVLWVMPVVAVLLMLRYFDLLVAGVIEVPYARQDSYWTRLGTRIFEAQAILTATLGIIAALGTIVESPKESVTRRQAKWCAATFVTWEVLQVTAFIILEVAFRSPNPSIHLYTLVAAVLFPGASLLFVLMLGYSTVKAQLFDVDLRVKWTVKQSTVAATFLVVFFVVSEAAQVVVATRAGQWIGIVAAGALLFALSPLQRFADQVANRTMPNTHATPAYVHFRKLEVYKGAVESAQADNAITERERAILDRLRRDLGIDPQDAEAVERDVLARAAA